MADSTPTSSRHPDSSNAARSYRYDAFISYRHVEPDRGWAKWLHSSLETYRVPKELVAKGLPKKLTRVFRDEEELPANANLSSQITAALEDSKFLIVICSPRAVESRWVNAEVEHFRRLGRNDQILALLIEGEPGVSFPPALTQIRRTLTDAAGQSREEIEEVEPLAADVRPERTDIKATVLRSHARLRLLACILGCRFDDLRQREAERRAKRARMIGAVLAAIALVLAGLSAYALTQRTEALTQRDQARAAQKRADDNAAEAGRQTTLAQASERLAREREKTAKERLSAILAVQARELAGKGAWPLSLAKLNEARTQAPLDVQGNFLLREAFRLTSPLRLVQSGFVEGQIRLGPVGTDGFLVVDGSGRASLWSPTTPGADNFTQQAPLDATIAAWSSDATVMVARTEQGLFVVRSGDDTPPMPIGAGQDAFEQVVLSPRGDLAITTSSLRGAGLWSCKTGRQLAKLDDWEHTHRVVFSADSALVTMFSSKTDELLVYDTDRREERCRLRLPKRACTPNLERADAAVSARAGLVACAGQDNEVLLWSLDDPASPRSLKFEGFCVNSLAFTDAGDRLLVMHSGTDATLFRCADGTPLARYRGQLTINENGETPRGAGAAFSRDEKTVLTWSRSGGALWEADTGQPLGWLDCGDELVVDGCFLPTGTGIALVTREGFLRLFDRSPAQRVVWQGNGMTNPGDEPFISASGDRFVILDTSGDAAIRRITDGSLVATLAHPEGHPFFSATCSPAGDLVLTSDSNGFAQLWEGASGHPLRNLARKSDDGQSPSARLDDILGSLTMGGVVPTVASWSVDGTRVAVSDFTRLETAIWSVPDGRLIGVVQLMDVVGRDGMISFGGAILSPDGARVAMVSQTGRFEPNPRPALIVCDAALGKITARIDLSMIGGVTHARFSPDGAHIVCAGLGSSVIVAPCDAPGPIRTLPHGALVSRVLFNPTGSTLLTLCDDRRIRTWSGADFSLRDSLDTRRERTGFFIPMGPVPDAPSLAAFDRSGLVRVLTRNGRLMIWAPGEEAAAREMLVERAVSSCYAMDSDTSGRRTIVCSSELLAGERAFQVRVYETDSDRTPTADEAEAVLERLHIQRLAKPN